MPQEPDILLSTKSWEEYRIYVINSLSEIKETARASYDDLRCDIETVLDKIAHASKELADKMDINKQDIETKLSSSIRHQDNKIAELDTRTNKTDKRVDNIYVGVSVLVAAITILINLAGLLIKFVDR